MGIMLNGQHLLHYRKICLNELKKQYEVSDTQYNDALIVEGACKICIETLVKEFIDVSKTITSMDVISLFLYNYGSYRKSNDSRLPEKERAIFRKLCRYMFGEFTKLNINHFDKGFADSEVISKLYFITQLIDNYSQSLNELYITNKNAVQLELYEQEFAITVSDNDYYEYQHLIKKSLNAESFKGCCFPV